MPSTRCQAQDSNCGGILHNGEGNDIETCSREQLVNRSPEAIESTGSERAGATVYDDSCICAASPI